MWIAVPVRFTTMQDCTEGVSFNASSTAGFSLISVPRRQPPSAVTTTLHCASLMRSISAVLEKPPKTTEWVAPIRAQASIDRQLRNQRQVKRDAVAFFDAKVF